MITDASIDALIESSLRHSEMLLPATASRRWTEDENDFIRNNLGWLTDAEMGAILERTEVAVHIRWKRELNLSTPSKSPDVITANRAADALGIDVHKIAGWVDAGLLPGRLMAGDRNIRLIKRITFLRWSITPENWIYFHIDRVKDAHLKRLIQLRALRWGNEWWSTQQVAEYHGVTTQDVKRYIKSGRIRATQAQYSIGGRHSDRRWSNWFVLKSEATRSDLVFCTRKTGNIKRFTPRAEAWIIHARDDLKLEYKDIVRTMKLDFEFRRPWYLSHYYDKAKKEML